MVRSADRDHCLCSHTTAPYQSLSCQYFLSILHECKAILPATDNGDLLETRGSLYTYDLARINLLTGPVLLCHIEDVVFGVYVVLVVTLCAVLLRLIQIGESPFEDFACRIDRALILRLYL